MAGLPGLGSGYPTTELIAELMAIDRNSQTLIKNKVTSNTTTVTALQELNAKIAALGVLAAKLDKPSELDNLTATSSGAGASGTVGIGASAGQIDVLVTALAKSQASVTGAKTAWAGSVITITGASGAPVELTAASNSLDDIVTAVNASATGVTATKVAAGVDGAGVPQFRLQFTGKETGAANAFTVLEGTPGAGTDVLTQPGAAAVRVASDASLTLFAGTAAEQVITSKSNTFAELLPGVAVTVSAVSATPATITVSRNAEKTTDAAKGLIAAVNDAIAFITARTVATASVDANGNAYTAGGAFTGDRTVRDVNQKVLAAASAPIDGISPSEYGISITKTGTMEFNAEKFAAALAKDPAKTQAAVAEIATRLVVATDSISNKTTGSITTKINGQESTIKSLKEEVSKWDDRLEKRQANLERYYTAFEVSMGKLNAQMTWLTDQVNALNASKD
jgi:flagellar hook-associated protein 2